MKRNIKLKSVEEIIIKNKMRKSNIISVTHSLLENIYTNYIKYYCNNDNIRFEEAVSEILKQYPFWDNDFERTNLLIIKHLIINTLCDGVAMRGFDYSIFKFSELVKCEIKYKEYDSNKNWPIFSCYIDFDYFNEVFNKHTDSPLNITRNKIALKPVYNNIDINNIDNNKDSSLINALNHLNVTSIVRKYVNMYDILKETIVKIEENLNKKYEG